jgi:putative ABC transport system ATP-binding protein
VEPILKTENLWKLYHAGKVEVPALRGVNFEVLPGESVAVRDAENRRCCM